MQKILISFCLLLAVFNTNAQDVERKKLVQQLQTLKVAVLANDKATVARFFTFPLKNANIRSKIEASGNLTIKSNTLDRAQFLKFYKHFFTPEVVELFKQLNFSKLEVQEELIVQVPSKSKTDYCTYTYEMVFMNNQVGLTLLLNTRQDIELPEMAYCEEHAEFWTFEWVDGKLLFRSLEIAG